MIPIPQNIADGSVNDRVRKAGIVRDLIGIPILEHGRTVRFHVGLGHEVKSKPVAQLREPWRVRIVARADGVDIVRLHHLQIPERIRLADRSSGIRVAVVAVYAAQENRCAVEQKPAVFDRDGADADALPDGFLRRPDRQLVQRGAFRAPKLRLLDPEVKDAAVPYRRPALPAALDTAFQRGLAALGGQRDPQVCLLPVGGQAGRDGPVHGMLPRTQQQPDVPENTACAEFILILKIRSVAPFEDEDGYPVFAGPGLIGDAELAGAVADLTVAREFAVDPEIEAGIDALKIQIPFVPAFRLREAEHGLISAAGIFTGDIRRLKRNRIADVDVLMAVISEALPTGRDVDLAEGSLLFLRKVLRNVGQTAEITEVPRPAAEQARTGASVRHLRQIPSTGRLCADMQGMGILMILSLKLQGKHPFCVPSSWVYLKAGNAAIGAKRSADRTH